MATKTLPPVEVVATEEVAKLLGTTVQKIHAAVINGTFPVGLAIDGDKNRTIILKARLEAWLNAKDMNGDR